VSELDAHIRILRDTFVILNTGSSLSGARRGRVSVLKGKVSSRTVLKWSGRVDLNTDLLVPNQKVEKSKALRVSHLRFRRAPKTRLSWSTQWSTILSDLFPQILVELRTSQLQSGFSLQTFNG